MKRQLLLAMTLLSLSAPVVTAREYVILLHGLCRTSRSMRVMERSLAAAGYQVVNVDYPSRTAPVERLSEWAIAPAVTACQRDGATTIHFVTHSLGGILVRSYLARHTIPELGRVVMLGPPNQGSELVDKLGTLWFFKRINGPAGDELGTEVHSVTCRLGPANFCVGVIAGNRSINWINSCLIPGPDDGKVSVARARLEGMTDFVVVPATHPFLMRNRTVIRQTLAFLQTGRFEH